MVGVSFEVMEKNREIARTLGTTVLIPRLPSKVKDANDWLAKHNAMAEDVQTVLNKAKTWLQAENERITDLEGLERKNGLSALFQYVLDLHKIENWNRKSKRQKIFCRFDMREGQDSNLRSDFVG